MSRSRSIPIRYSEEELQRLEPAAALAGYKHLSTFIRDRSLDRVGGGRNSDEGIGAWAERQELTGRLAALDQQQRSTEALLLMVLALIRKKATTGEINELRALIEHSNGDRESLAGAAFPGLPALLDRITEGP